jgi:hypothetical protein
MAKRTPKIVHKQPLNLPKAISNLSDEILKFDPINICEEFTKFTPNSNKKCLSFSLFSHCSKI